MKHTPPETQDAFKFSIIAQFYMAMHEKVPDNYDSARFSSDGVDRSDQFVMREHIFFLDWFFTNLAKIHEAYTYLADDESRAIYKDLLIFRLVGHLHYRVRSTIHSTLDKCAQLAQVAVAQESQLQTTGAFGTLKHHDFEWEGKRYTIDCLEGGLMYTLAIGHYFLQRDGISVQPEEGDHVIDGGACLGDTALAFSNAVGPSGHVYAFDPVEDHLLVCFFNVEQFALPNVTVFPAGLFDKNVDAPPIRLNTYAPGFSSSHAVNNNQVLPLRTLDFMVDSGEVERVDFIKLDVEGAEMETLRGAWVTIEAFRPKMAISLYHKPDDFFQIINHIRGSHPHYALYLNHHSIHREETVLYCLPNACT